MRLPNLKVAAVFFIITSAVFSQKKPSLINKSVDVKYVLNKYVKALGGENTLKTINNKIQKTSMLSSINIGGNKTTTENKMIQVITKDGKMVSIIGNDKGLVSKVYFDGTNGYTYIKATDSKIAFDESTIKMYEKTIRLFPNTEKRSAYSKEIIIQEFNNENCYVLVNKVMTGDIKEYYSVDSGLLIGSSIKTKSTEFVNFISDYRLINGIQTSLHQTSNTKVSTGVTVVSSVKIEEVYYNGMVDSYFNQDNETSARQIASIPISKSIHEDKIKNIGSIVPKAIIKSDSTKNTIGAITSAKTAIVSSSSTNKRDIIFKEILKNKGIASNTTSTASTATVTTTGKRTDVEDLEGEYKDFKDLKYRRSSLYTLMINDSKRERNDVIRNAFGDSELSPKFNNHNIGPYLINGKGGVKDQTKLIEGYLNENNVARELVAKWFNRQSDGSFSMDLIANRGQYNASELSKQIAKNSIRGQSLLKDAGVELLGNTFIIVYDYKYTNKEKTAKKRGGFLSAISSIASIIPGGENVASVTDVVKLGSDVVGKGYYVRTTTYLYKLVWDDEIANTFYANYWVDSSNIDSKKRDAFDVSTAFKLKYVGSEISRNNLQSTIFTKKNNNELIKIATIRAVDKNIGKLQRTFEEFRVKTPLLSGNPISAKIGTKEGVKKGDKFEVLEQLMDEEGITSYKRVGVIKVNKNNIWDNMYLSKEQEEAKKSAPKPKKESILSSLYGTNKTKKKKKKKSRVSLFSKKKKKEVKKEGKLEYTKFTGKKGKFASGMLIRQIN